MISPPARDASYAGTVQEINVHAKASGVSPIVLKLLSEHAPAGAGGELVLVLELAAGGELFESIITRAHYSENCARLAFVQVATGLAALHSRGIVHRDIKPENILILGKGDAASQAPDAALRLADFGLAFSMGSTDTWAKHANEPNARVVGTTFYAGPELFNHPPRFGPKNDVWSAGVLLFILLGGYFPFSAEGTYETEIEEEKAVGRAVTSGAVDWSDPLWGQVSPAAKDCINLMLTVDDAARPTMDQVLAHPWLAGAEAAVSRARANSITELAGGAAAPAEKASPYHKSQPHLASTRANIVSFLARKKMRKLIHTVLAVKNFARGGLLRSTLAGALASVVDAPSLAEPERLAELATAFRAVAASEADLDGNSVSPAGLEAVLLSPPLSLTVALVKNLITERRIFAHLDANGDGRVDWREFLVVLPLLTTGSAITPLIAQSDETLKALFSIWGDPASGGLLDTATVVDLVRVLHAHDGDEETGLSAAALSQLFNTVAHAGRVGWKEFKDALHSAAGAKVGSLSMSLSNVASSKRLRLPRYASEEEAGEGVDAPDAREKK